MPLSALSPAPLNTISLGKILVSNLYRILLAWFGDPFAEVC